MGDFGTKVWERDKGLGVADWKDVVNGHVKMVKTVQDINSRLSEEVQAYRETYTALETEHNALKFEIDGLKKLLNKKEAKYNELKNQAESGNDELRAALEKLSTSNAQLKEKIASYERRQAEHKRAILDSAAMERQSEAERTQLVEQVRELRKEVLAKTTECEQQEKAYNSDNEMLGKKLYEATAKEAAAEREAESLRAMYEEKETETEAVTQKYNDLVAKTARLEDQLKEVADELEMAQTSNDSKEELERLQAEYDKLRDLREQEKASVGESTEQLREANKDLQATLKRYAKIHAKRDKFKDFVNANFDLENFDTIEVEKNKDGSFDAWYEPEEDDS